MVQLTRGGEPVRMGKRTGEFVSLEESVTELEPHRMVFYLLDLAGEFHRYYNRHRVISDDAGLSRVRLLLVENVQKTIRQGLDILGVDAPMKMASRSEVDSTEP